MTSNQRKLSQPLALSHHPVIYNPDKSARGMLTDSNETGVKATNVLLACKSPISISASKAHLTTDSQPASLAIIVTYGVQVVEWSHFCDICVLKICCIKFLIIHILTQINKTSFLLDNSTYLNSDSSRGSISRYIILLLFLV